MYNVCDISKGTCAFFSSNQLALYIELFQNHELMSFCEMRCQVTYFLMHFIFYSSVFWFILTTPFSSMGILEKIVCPLTWGNKDMNYVSVLIFRPDVK